jgi:hypothetical protein
VAQNRPRAVVEAPAAVQPNWDWRNEPLDAKGKLGIAGRGILHLVQFPGNPPKSWIVLRAVLTVTAAPSMYR